MKKKKITKLIFIVGLTLLALFLTAISWMIIFSSYGNQDGWDNKILKESILIKASPEQVYRYLGNSDNARDWSVYVDHISPINAEEVPDGAKGSVRRCFVDENEKDKSWDEVILDLEPNKRRILSCYNYKGFNLTAGVLHTEQVYEKTENGDCRLSFLLYLSPEDRTLVNHLKMYFASYTVSDIFKKNLNNIREYNEHKVNAKQSEQK